MIFFLSTITPCLFKVEEPQLTHWIHNPPGPFRLGLLYLVHYGTQCALCFGIANYAKPPRGFRLHFLSINKQKQQHMNENSTHKIDSCILKQSNENLDLMSVNSFVSTGTVYVQFSTLLRSMGTILPMQVE